MGSERNCSRLLPEPHQHSLKIPTPVLLSHDSSRISFTRSIEPSLIRAAAQYASVLCWHV